MKPSILLISLIAACAFLTQAQSTVPPDLSGTWVESSNPDIKWILVEHDGKLHFQEMNADKQIRDFTCSLTGQECDAKEDGHPEKVMAYYNGPALVTIEERGNEVLKQRITISTDGKTLQVKTVPLSQSQKPEVLTFQRQATST